MKAHWALGLAVLLLAVPAGAATLTVDTPVDEFDLTPNGTCSLREAVESANQNADFGGCVGDGTYGDDTILLPAGIYGLSRSPAEDFLDLDNSVGDLDVASGGGTLTSSLRGALRLDRGIFVGESLEILGAGAATTIIERVSSEIFGIFDTFFPSSLRLVDLTVRGGEQVAGAGIFADFDLSLERVVVRDNVARAVDAGGGGLVVFGALTLVDTLVTSNQVVLEDPCDVGPDTTGGGIIAFALGPVLIERSTISNNAVTGDPGCEGFGGGLGILGGLGLVRVVNSTVSGNSAPLGGGIDFLSEGFSGALETSLGRQGRTARASSWVYKRGSSRLERGITPLPPPPSNLSLEHVTVTENSADEVGGLNLLGNDTGEAVIANTLIGGNTAADAPDCSNSGVTVTSQGVNLLSIDEPLADDVACLTAPPDLVGTLASPLEPLLGPLQNNGGLTPTHALRPGSPALDATTSQGASEDQRGVTRPFGSGFDIGAFEAGVTVIPTLGEWGLLLLVTSLVASGLWWMRR